ncbi:MAG: PKD domain-containing protein [Thermoleophilia bacterium]
MWARSAGRAAAVGCAAIALATAGSGMAAGAEDIRAPGNCWPVGWIAPFQATNDPWSLPPGAVTWDFGDGAQGSGPNGIHRYQRPGLYRVRLAVTRSGVISEGTVHIFATATGGPRQLCRIFRLSSVRHDGRTVTARVLLPDRTGAAGRRVGLRDPDGVVVTTAVSDDAGHVLLRSPEPLLGDWTMVLLDDAKANSRPVRVGGRPRITVAAPTRPVGPGADLVVAGRLSPPVPGKLVQLEFRADGVWRPIVQSTAGRSGAFALRYRFRQTGASYGVRMRVTAPKDRGWPYPTLASRGFTVRVSG